MDIVEHHVYIHQRVECKNCNGTGRVIKETKYLAISGRKPTYKEEDCEECGGTGFIME
jgi:DnaJ-class molecular chaperone